MGNTYSVQSGGNAFYAEMMGKVAQPNNQPKNNNSNLPDLPNNNTNIQNDGVNNTQYTTGRIPSSDGSLFGGVTLDEGSIVDPNFQAPTEDSIGTDLGKQVGEMNSANKLNLHGTSAMAKSGVNWLSKVAYSKAFNAGTTKAITETVLKTSEQAVSKTGSKVISHIAAKNVEKGLEQGLARAGVDLTAKSTQIGGNFLSKIGKAFSVGAAYKEGASIISKGLGKSIKANILGNGNTARIAGEVVEKVAANSMDDLATKSISRAGVVAEKAFSGAVTGKAGEKILETVTSKVADDVAIKGTSMLGKTGKFLGRVAPAIGTGLGAYITYKDTKDAINKFNDPNVSTVSKALAGVTVGLDVVSTVGTAAGAHKVSLTTGVASILTSVASDLTK